jgi:type I restriction enzyme S subunit
MAVGSTIKTLGLPFFKMMRIPLPPLHEQQRIAQTLLQIESTIWSGERAALLELNSLKRGLMQDLLTGRVRVQAD